MIQRSPVKGTSTRPSSVVEVTNVETPAGIPQGEPPNYVHAARKAPTEDISVRRYSFVVVDFISDTANAFLPWSVLADFIFTDLQIRKTEIAALMTTRGPAITSSRIRTHEVIDVKVRFGGKFEFARHSNGVNWKCVVRGAQRFSPLRYLHIFGEIPVEELAKANEAFAELKSNITKEVFENHHDARLGGIPNGHMRALILPSAPIPDFIEVGSRKIWISHRDQVQKCFRCRKEGHLKNKCPQLHPEFEGVKFETSQEQPSLIDEAKTPMDQEYSSSRLDENKEIEDAINTEDLEITSQSVVASDGSGNSKWIVVSKNNRPKKDQNIQSNCSTKTGTRIAKRLRGKDIQEEKENQGNQEKEEEHGKENERENQKVEDAIPRILTRSTSLSLRDDPPRGVSESRGKTGRDDPPRGVSERNT